MYVYLEDRVTKLRVSMIETVREVSKHIKEPDPLLLPPIRSAKDIISEHLAHTGKLHGMHQDPEGLDRLIAQRRLDKKRVYDRAMKKYNEQPARYECRTQSGGTYITLTDPFLSEDF